MPALCLLSLLTEASLAAPKWANTPQARTFVSGLGNDTDPCTAQQPCRTLGAALALTTADGEIYVLDSADYGPVTITKGVTILGDGAVAGVLVTTGVGISISAGANDVITLRGLNVDGAKTGSVGIQFNSGKTLNLQKSVLRGFVSTGLNFAPTGASTLFASENSVTNNVNNGILVSASTSAGGTLDRVTATGNGVGIFASGAMVKITISDTVANNNNYGLGASAAAVMVRNSTFNNNLVGIAADQNGIIQVGQSTITANATGWRASNGAQVQSYGNNSVSGNTADGIVTKTVALQ